MKIVNILMIIVAQNDDSEYIIDRSDNKSHNKNSDNKR